MGRRFVILIALAVGLWSGAGPATGSVAGAGISMDWPVYRFDLAHTAYNPNESMLSPSNVGTLTKKWSRVIDYYAAPNPVIVDGVLYAVSYFGYVYGLDAATGQTVWKVRTGGLTKGALAVGGGEVFVGTLDGDVIAYDLATRAERWRARLGAPVYWAPTLYGDSLYVSADTLYALDIGTGSVLWSNGNEPNSAPAVANDLLYFTQNSGTLSALDPSTGQTAWVAFTPEGYPSEVAVSDGVVALSDNGVYAYDALSGELLWRNGGGTGSTTPAIANGVVYVVEASSPYGASAYDLQSGSLLWHSSHGFIGFGPAIANGVLYPQANDQYPRALDASTGEVLWKGPRMGANLWGAPVISDGILYESAYNGRIEAFSLP